MIISETFQWAGVLPVSPCDGYEYSRDELTSIDGDSATFRRSPVDGNTAAHFSEVK